MQDQLSALLAKAQAEFPTLKTRPDFEAAKARYVGPNGELTALMKQMGAVPKEQRPALGRLINEAKAQLQVLFDTTLRALEDAEIAAQLGPPLAQGDRVQIDDAVDAVVRLLHGDVVADGAEVIAEMQGAGRLRAGEDAPAARRGRLFCAGGGFGHM